MNLLYDLQMISPDIPFDNSPHEPHHHDQKTNTTKKAFQQINPWGCYNYNYRDVTVCLFEQSLRQTRRYITLML